MKKKAPLFVIAISTVFAALGAFGGSMAWFSYKAEMKNEDNPIFGSVQDEYYARGNGTESDPYIINKPRHLYNLAWLQYLGFYNKNDGGDNDHQFYFELEDNIDMGEFGPIPPIGTEENPFVGSFDGNGYAVSNVTISNKFSDYNAHPSIIDGWDETKDYNQPHILGFFGVIGDYAGAIKPTDYSSAANAFVNTALTGVTVETETADSLMGIAAGYVNVNNLSTDAATDNKSAPKTKNIIVDDSSLVLPESGTTTTSYGGFTTNISDYTLVGYTNDTSGLVKASKSINGVNKETNLTFPAPNIGDAIGFGGSIGMDELFTRIDTFRNSSAKKQFSTQTGEFHYYNNGVEDLSKATTTNSNQNSYEYYNDDLTGRVVYGQTQTNYLWGKRTYSLTYTITKEYHTDDDETCYYIVSNNYYLYATGGNVTRNSNNRTLLFEDENGWIYYKYDNKIYYLYSTVTTNKGKVTYDTNVRSSTNQQDYMFKLVNNRLTLYKVSDNSNQNKYINYNNKNPYFRVDGNSVAVTTTTEYKTETTTETRTYDTHGTYLPLNVYKTSDSEKMAADQAKLNELYGEDKAETLIVNGAKYNNTGYIIGGTKTQSDSYGCSVRIDGTQYNFGHISRALGGASSYALDENGNVDLQILTRTKDSNGVTFIEDKFNKPYDLSGDLTSLSYVGTANKKKSDAATLGLNSYTSARDNLHKQFSSATNNRLYVMRFNEFQVNLQHTITAEKVLLNGEVKTDYVFPESCIDFNLKQKGYISFFGGGFRGGNCNAFFSLYHIVRDSDDNITSFKRLNKIYGTKSSRYPYVYEYRDSSNSGEITYASYDKVNGVYETITNLPTDYSLHFDLNWVEAPGFTAVDNTLWYFEIPVNEGEYALGAVDGRTGAYMMYLDVGSNAAQATRTIMYEKFIYNEQSFRFPTGVSLKSITINEESESAIITELTVVIDDSDSATMMILAEANGSYAIDRDNNSVTVDRDNPNKAPPTFASDKLTLFNENEVAIDPTGNATFANEIHRMTYYDYIPTNNSLLVTVFADYYDIDPENEGALSHARRTIEQYTFANTTTVPSDISTGTLVAYDSAIESTKANLENINVYKAAGGGAYEDDIITDWTTNGLPIDTTKLSSTTILTYRVIENGTETYTDSTIITAIVDTEFTDTTYYYYDFGGYVITLTPDGTGTVVVNVSDYTNSFTMTTYADTYTGGYSTKTITIDGTTIQIVINGVTVTGVNQTIPESTNP